MRAGDYLRTALPDLPESVLRRVFDARDIKLDGVRISRNDRLTEGSCLKIYLPDSVSGNDTPVSSLSVVYEDDDVLLVNKRAGISVEPDARGGVTLTDLCREYVRRRDPDVFPPAACHRLDNKTCGLCRNAMRAPGANNPTISGEVLRPPPDRATPLRGGPLIVPASNEINLRARRQVDFCPALCYDRIKGGIRVGSARATAV